MAVMKIDLEQETKTSPDLLKPDGDETGTELVGYRRLLEMTGDGY
jgi:hypothetical protein